jgi:hypothetical protein
MSMSDVKSSNICERGGSAALALHERISHDVWMHPNVRAAALAGALFLAVVTFYVNVWIASISLALVASVGYY